MKVFSNLAISLDGRIADLSHPSVMLGTPYDRRLMDHIRQKADAVVFGAGTLRVTGECVKRKASLARKAKARQIVNVVLCSSGSLSPKLKFWTEKEVLRYVFTHPDNYQKLLKSSRDRAFIIPSQASSRSSRISFKEVLDRLKESGLKNILVEGGGEVMRAALEENLIDELYVTLTPHLIGGRANPSLVGGIKALSPWAKLRLLKSKKVKDEIYLHYQVKK